MEIRELPDVKLTEGWLMVSKEDKGEDIGWSGVGRGSCIGNRTEKGKLFTHLLKTEFHLIKHLDFFDFDSGHFHFLCHCNG